ncbi:MAG: hypothetical protein HWE12_05550 [Oceanospirillaceae bacterium]|nr:hypothetical protein [Oceanospirillaceae bacterium]
MTPIQTGLLILAGLGLFIIAALVMQGIENQKRQKRLRVLAIKDQIRRADHLFHALPAPLRTAAMDKLLINYLLQHWREIASLDSAAGAKAQIEALNLRTQQLSDGPVAAAGLTLFPDREQARSARAIMREFAQFLTDLTKSGRYSVGQIQPIMNQAKIAYARARLDLELMDAKLIEQNRGPTVALHQYRSCIRTIEKLKNYVQMDAQLAHTENLLQQAELRTEEERERQQQALKDEQEETPRIATPPPPSSDT